jgi:hypothetical protein
MFDLGGRKIPCETIDTTCTAVKGSENFKLN